MRLQISKILLDRRNAKLVGLLRDDPRIAVGIRLG